LKISIPKYYVLALLAIGLWSTVATAFKIALGETSTVMLLWISSTTAAIVLCIILFFEKRNQSRLFYHWKTSALNGFINPFLYYLVLFKAYDLLPAQIAQPLNYTWPLVLTGFSVLFLKIKIGFFSWIGLIISLIGVAVVANSKTGSYSYSSLGLSLAIGSSILWAAYWILNLKDDRPESNKLFLNFLFGSIYISLYIIFSNTSFQISTKGLMASIYIGLFEMGITFKLWLDALKLSQNPSKINNLVFISPILSFVFIAIFLKEHIEWITIAGFITIILGIILSKVKTSQKV